MALKSPKKSRSTSADDSGLTGRSMAARQRWVFFRLLALLTPVLLLVAAEIFLRIAGYGYQTSFFLKQRLNGREVLTDNWQFGWRFFPRNLARTPQPVVFDAHKAPGTIRIFVFGESAAMGDPEPSFGLPRMLQAMLELSFPSNRFEVINVAMTAINSHVIREIAKDCAPLEGDIWIVYMGNNEVVGPFGAGTVFGRQVPSLAFIRAGLWLKRFRVAQFLYSLGERGPTEWEGMEMFLKNQVRHDDPRMTKVYAHFRDNLCEIIRIGTGAGAKVLVGTVAVNLKDCPPFASQHSAPFIETQRTEFTQQFASGLEKASQGAFGEALAAFSKAARAPANDTNNTNAITRRASDHEDHFAEVYFHLARCELALGRTDEARRDFNAAKEYDTLRFRADDGIELALRETSNSLRSASRLVDTATSLCRASSNGICGAELFYEHVHLTFAGNYQLARAFFDDVVRALPATVASVNVPPPSMEDCARRLAWTDWDRLHVFEEVRKRLQQPPFTAQFGHVARDSEWRIRIEKLAASLTPENYRHTVDSYEQALLASTNDWVLHENFAKLLEANGDTAAALQQWSTVAHLLPHDIQAQYHMGNLLDSLGRSEEALVHFRAALARNPLSVEGRNGLALALGALGKATEAEREFRTALRLKPKFTEARVNLGQLLAQQGKFDAAIKEYETALLIDTNSVAAHVNLGKLLNQRGNKAAAVSHYEAALRIDPKNAFAHYNLGNTLLGGPPGEAARHFAEAVRTQPDFGEAHLALALELAKTGRMAEADEHFADAIRLRPNSADAHFNYGVSLANQKRFTEAAREFSLTLKLQPDHQKAREFLQRVERMR